MIWSIFFLLAVISLAVTKFFARQNKPTGPLDYYKNQLTELDNDIKRGLVTEESVKSAQLEIERRILKTNAKLASQPSATLTKKSLPLWQEILAAFTITLSAFLIYKYFGSPNIDASPAARSNLENQRVSEDGPTFKVAIATIESHLATNPDDPEGWEVLSTSTRAIGNYAKTIHAYDQLIRLQPDKIDWDIRRLEAYISMANGKVTPAANLLIGTIVEKSPNHPAGQFYLGLAHKQYGNPELAFEIWQDLLNQSAPNAPWYAVLDSQLKELRPQVSEFTTQGPSKSDIEAVANLSPEER